MRPAILLCMFVLFGYIANAQFTILPQVGFENSKTSVELNEHSSFAPAGAKLSPQIALRLDYNLKKGSGPYVGIATSRSVTKLNFTDPETVMNNFTTSKGNTQLRIEGGYKVTTRPIFFKKSAPTANSSKVNFQKNNERKCCASYQSKSNCGNRMSKTSSAKSSDSRSWLRIQPSVGMAFLPGAPTSEIVTKSQNNQTAYQYNAGAWNTAVEAGVGFVFGKGAKQNLVISLNYVKGLGSQNSEITTLGNKPTVTSLESHASSWNVRMGIPITLSKKKATVKQQPIQKIYYREKKCSQYVPQYHSRCSKRI